MLDLADLRHAPKAPQYRQYGSLLVRYGKASRGSPPKRRTVLTAPEMDWIVDVLDQWVTEIRPLFSPGKHPALFVTERAGRMSLRGLNVAFSQASEAAGLSPELDLHSLRHSYVTHLVEFDYPERFVQVLSSPRMGVHDVHHEPGRCGILRAGGGYLRSSVTQIPRRSDACAAGADARLVA